MSKGVPLTLLAIGLYAGCGGSPGGADMASISGVDLALTRAGASTNDANCPPSIELDRLSPPQINCSLSPSVYCKYAEYICSCHADQLLYCGAP
jgi:hypothetical protein